jgi:hypothetical protein
MARGYAFRFCLVYVALWCAATQVLGGIALTPFGALPALGPLWPMRAITEWTALHLFGVTATFEPGNSGDTVFYWTQTFWIFVVALIAAAIWSYVVKVRPKPDPANARAGSNRRGATHGGAGFSRPFRLFLRFALASQMFYFGMAKVVPTQFVPPALTTLVQPIGNMGLSNLLWIFMGSSTPYQVFTGGAELAAGLLLLSPRTTPLGALIALADMTQVFALNMAYDVGLKQIAFHFIVMALLLLAPDAKRLAGALVRSDERVHWPQVAFGAYLLATFAVLQLAQWRAPESPAHPRSALYGIWDIDELSVDAGVRPVALNDYDRRWRRAIFDFPERMAFQRTDDSLARYGVTIDTARRTLMLTKGNSRTWSASFAFERPADDRLTLDGEMDGHAIRMRLSRVGMDTFPLLNSDFRWVRPADAAR